MSIENLFMATGSKNRVVEPVGIDFDGTNDYLSRSSDLAGNADGKTFTFSVWAYVTSSSPMVCYFVGDPGVTTRFHVRGETDWLQILGADSSGNTILSVYTGTGLPKNTWSHLLVSIDLRNTSNRKIFLNGDDLTSTMTWGTYTNTPIDFTYGVHTIAQIGSTIWPFKGRLAHLFLDYTYRDLSIEANRRLFITADGKPAKGQSSLNPILYLPMDDPEAPGVNLGTGGDFNLNGVVAQSQRGPSQWNCVASDFDGTNDYLSSAGVGMIDGKQFTFSATLKLSAPGGNGSVPLAIKSGSSSGDWMFYISLSDTGGFIISGYNSAGTKVFSFNGIAGDFVECTRTFTFSVDLSDPGKRMVLVDGVEYVGNGYPTYVNDNIGFGSGAYNSVGHYVYNSTDYLWRGNVGELYFDTTYIDLATSNPFWDEDTQKPKPVLQVLEETGNTPLIAMPIRADDAGRNYGTGGDFTVNSGPFIGARGASEFWARSAYADGADVNYISKSLTTSTKTFSMAVATKGEAVYPLHTSNSAGPYAHIRADENTFQLRFNDATQEILNVVDNTLSGSNAGKWNVYLISVDMTQAFLGYAVKVWVNGTFINTFTNYAFVQNANIDLSTALHPEIKLFGDSFSVTGSLSVMYFTTDYIDFSQESERLKFVDAFGYPVDIRPAIENGDIPEPLIYMPFDDPNDLGKNLGTGGDFTVNGTVTPGADVDPN